MLDESLPSSENKGKKRLALILSLSLLTVAIILSIIVVVVIKLNDDNFVPGEVTGNQINARVTCSYCYDEGIDNIVFCQGKEGAEFSSEEETSKTFDKIAIRMNGHDRVKISYTIENRDSEGKILLSWEENLSDDNNNANIVYKLNGLALSNYVLNGGESVRLDIEITVIDKTKNMDLRGGVEIILQKDF